MIVRHRVRPQSTWLKRMAIVPAALLLLTPWLQAGTPVAAAKVLAMRLGSAAQRGEPLAFTPDNKKLFTSEPKVVRLWDIASGKLIREFPAADGETFQFGAAVTPDGKALVGNAWGRVSMWDVETGKLRKTCTFPASYSQNFGLMPDGKTAVWVDGKVTRDRLLGHRDRQGPPAAQGPAGAEGIVARHVGVRLFARRQAHASRRKLDGTPRIQPRSRKYFPP